MPTPYYPDHPDSPAPVHDPVADVTSDTSERNWKSWAKDTADRVVRTFIAAAVPLVTLQAFLSMDTLKAAGIAAGIAGCTAVLALLTKPIGDPGTASTVTTLVK